MTIVRRHARVATEDVGASTETAVIRRVAGRENGRQHSIASFDGFVVEDRLVAAGIVAREQQATWTIAGMPPAWSDDRA